MIKEHNGSVPIIMALVFIVLLVIAAFVIDFGLVYLRTADMQNASDSAALAAASLLPVENGGSVTAVEQKAKEYLALNGINEDDYTIDVQLNLSTNNLYYTSVTVVVHKQEQLYIAPVIGVSNLNVSRTATAQISPAIGVRNVVPLSVTKEYLESAKASGATENLELKLGASDDDVYSGAFGPLYLEGSSGGANIHEDWLKYGYQGILKVGQILDVNTGNMSNPTNRGVDYRIDLCTHYPTEGCTVDQYVGTCPRIVTIPVITYNSAHEVTIKGFAAFILEGCAGQGNKCYVYGSFLNDLVVNGEGSLDDEIGGPNDFGLYSISLID